MKLVERIKALGQLGEYLQKKESPLQAAIQLAHSHNQWFTSDNVEHAIEVIVTNLLDPSKLHDWVQAYSIDDNKVSKRIAIVMADQVPLQGFYDMLSVFISGHQAVVKLAEKDTILIPHFIDVLNSIDARCAAYFEQAERLSNFDAVIATASDKTVSYFKTYFGKYPNIVRNSRHAVAVLDGTESFENLKGLGRDVFQYFGLGNRNVSKLYIPVDYNFDELLTAFHEYKELVMHHKYKNNFDYNYTIVILNKTTYHANGCIILTEEESVASRIASLYFEYYSDEHDLVEKLNKQNESIQFVMCKNKIEGWDVRPFGEAHDLELKESLNGVDVMGFLVGELAG